MPDRTALRPGDKIRLLRVPEGDLRQRERELRGGSEYAGWTADTIERILLQGPIVMIDRIDEYGSPWFDYELKAANGTIEEHSLAIMEDDSWEIANLSGKLLATSPLELHRLAIRNEGTLRGSRLFEFNA